MKTVLAIIVYNRFTNLQHWLACWKQCEQRATMVVIHTGDEVEKFSEACVMADVQYIWRKNVGMDIGAMQDVFRDRLLGFPQWDLLLWCCDDTMPMTKDFIDKFHSAMVPGVGIAAMQISKSVAPHVRTTGFMIRRETAIKIRFPADPVTTKGHCYHFEHRGGKDTLTNQVRAIGLSCVQVAPIRSSPMWDSAHPNARFRLDRRAEHDAVFNPRGDKVTFICTIYNSYPQIISSLLLQTHSNWELILIHDGPSSNGMRTYIPDDDRIQYIETDTRVGNWGHSYRQWALQEIKEGRLSKPDFICIGNSDNYLVPVFINRMLAGFKNPSTVATYTASMVHSYKNWDVIPCRFERGFIDCAGVIVRADVALDVGWRDVESHSADWVYFSDIAQRYGSKNFQPVKGCLLIHN